MAEKMRSDGSMPKRTESPLNFFADDKVFSMIKELFEMDISKKDLFDCKQEIILKIYSMFLRDIGYSVEKFSQIPFSAPADVHQYSHMYKDVSFPIAIFSCVKHFMKMVYDNTEFDMMDAISPEWNRTKKFLIMFIEFYNFVNDHLQKFDNVDEEVDKEKQMILDLKSKIKEYKEKIQKKELENVEAGIELEKVSISLKSETEEIEKCQETKNRYRGRLEGLKEEIKELNMKVKETELSLLELKEKLDTLKSQVIDENQYIEMEEGKKKLKMLEETNEKMKMTFIDHMQNLKFLNEFEDMITNVWIPTLTEYETEFDKKENLSKKFKDDKNFMAKLMEKFKELNSTVHALNENVKCEEEKESQLRQRKDFNINGLQVEIEQLQSTLEDIKRDSQEQVIVANSLQSDIKTISESTRQLTQKYEVFLEFINVQLEKIRTAFKEKMREDLENLKKSRIKETNENN